MLHSSRLLLRRAASLLAQRPRVVRAALATGCAAGGAAAVFGLPVPRCAGGGVNFINTPDTMVTEAIDGLIQANPGLTRIDGYPEVKVVVRSDWVSPENAHKVALISGGGAGHEPTHAGFVGKGMLTAAVSGDVFASPSAFAVLAAIRAVAYPGGEAQRQARRSPGVVLVVKNYTGDRINFTIAAEKARAEGIPVTMVVVADDCAIERSKGVTGRRGIAGTVFVHKIAGAAAEAGLGLEAVVAEARGAAASVGSVGVSASVCHIPGRPVSTRIKEGQMEMGLGIHGEPGHATIPSKPVGQLVEDMCRIIVDDTKDRKYMTLSRGDSVALMVNNLGSAIPMEVSIATKDVIDALEAKGVSVCRVVTGPLMTSMDMAGFSVSLLKLPSAPFAQKSMLQRLDACTGAPGWPRGGGARVASSAKELIPIANLKDQEKQYQRPVHLSETGEKVEAVLLGCAAALKRAEPALTEWDLKVGDGDCGLTFRKGAEATITDIKRYPLNSVGDSLEALTDTVAKSMGGTSGVLYRIFLLSLSTSARAYEGSSEPPTAAAAEAFSLAVEKLKTSGGAAEGDRTMLDALIPAARTLERAASLGTPLLPALEQAVIAAELGAESTKKMEARAGRSNYVPAAVLLANPDPGAKAAAIWMRAAYEALRSKSG